ncbi:MAG: DUF3037 domain-containing protein [Bacteroidetes bacterium]|nr:MAG: DUF3037 domain-containing protein [Bacteroidota bacterium]
MPAKAVYEYALIRVVPRVERGECLNVGVIVYCKDARFLDVRYEIDPARVAAFAPGLDLAEIRRYLQVWDHICQGEAAGGPIARLTLPERFRWLTAARSTIIQASPVHPGLCADPQETLHRLFDRCVAWA